MKKLLFPILLLSFLYGDHQKTTLSLKQIYYDKSRAETEFSGSTTYQVKQADLNTKLVVEYLYNSEHKKQYIYINEAFVTKEFKNYSVTVGKVIQYWGELEGYNITDVFNQKNYLYDPLNKDKKLGSWALLTSRYVGNNTFEIGMKFFEGDQKYPKNSAPFYPFTVGYEKGLAGKHSRWNPTFHAKYSFVTDDIVESETSLIYQQGFDNKRAISLSANHKLTQSAYKSKKYMIHSSIIKGDTIVKLEAAYTDVDDDAPVSDYQQAAVGIEQNIYNIMGIDTSVYAEYYNYQYKNKKQENIDISELYNNDVFLAAKLNFNDADSSEIKVGILYDLDTSEQILKAEAQTRVKDQVILHGEVMHIVNSTKSIASNFKDKTRSNIDISYNF